MSSQGRKFAVLCKANKTSGLPQRWIKQREALDGELSQDEEGQILVACRIEHLTVAKTNMSCLYDLHEYQTTIARITNPENKLHETAFHNRVTDRENKIWN